MRNRKIKKVAILASGGNSPGMNNVVITLVRKCRYYGIDVRLINNGFTGLLDDDFTKPDLQMLSYFYANGNILIGSSRCLPFRRLRYQKKAYNILKKHAIDCLFVIGGDGSYRGALSLKKLGMHVICLPGTIDNDIASTEKTIGFSTALNGIVTNIDSIRNSFDSHLGICLVEVMGRRFPDLAINAGIATQAEAIITVENVLTTKEIIDIAKETWKNKHRSCIIVVTEKIYGKNGLPSLEKIANDIENETGRIARVAVLGYTQRGGIPTAGDRNLASWMASYGLDLAISDPNESYTIDYIGSRVTHTQINRAVALPKKSVNVKLLKEFIKYCKF